jgi:hypothetical protein
LAAETPSEPSPPFSSQSTTPFQLSLSTNDISVSSSATCSFYRDHECDADVVCDACASSFPSMYSTCFTLTVPYLAFPNLELDELTEPSISVSEPICVKHPL